MEVCLTWFDCIVKCMKKILDINKSLAHRSFLSMEQLHVGVLLLLLDGMLVHLRLHPSILLGYPDSLLIPIYTPGWRGTVRVKCLDQEHNTVTQPGLEPVPFDPESTALTTRPAHLRHITIYNKPPSHNEHIFMFYFVRTPMLLHV